MLGIVIGFAMLAQGATGKGILADASARLERATTLSVTVVQTTEEFPRPRRTECAYRKGGYLRMDDGHVVRVANPKAAYAYSAKEKTYQPLPILSKDLKAVQAIGWLDMTVGNLPILDGPTSVVWHGTKALRIELDGRRAMTKETKLFVYLAPDTHLPLGVSANLGSITQVSIVKLLKLDPKLDDRLFTFTPPRGWRRRAP